MGATINIYPTPAGGGLESYAITRAQTVIPAANYALVTRFDGLGPAIRTALVVGGTVTSSLSTVNGGALIVDSSATANSAATVWPGVYAGGATTPSWTTNQRTGTYYLRFRAKFNSVGDSVTINTLGLTNVAGGAGQIRMGISGPVSAANFTYAITDSGATVQHSGSLGVAIETASFHTFEMWNSGGSMQFACDEGAPVSVTNGAGSTDPGAWLINAVNSTTAASRSVTVANITTVCVQP